MYELRIGIFRKPILELVVEVVKFVNAHLAGFSHVYYLQQDQGNAG